MDSEPLGNSVPGTYDPTLGPPATGGLSKRDVPTSGKPSSTPSGAPGFPKTLTCFSSPTERSTRSGGGRPGRPRRTRGRCGDVSRVRTCRRVGRRPSRPRTTSSTISSSPSRTGAGPWGPPVCRPIEELLGVDDSPREERHRVTCGGEGRSLYTPRIQDPRLGTPTSSARTGNFRDPPTPTAPRSRGTPA